MISRAASSGDVAVVSIRRSGFSGGSYGGVDAGEVDQLPASRLPVEPLGITLLRDLDGGVYEDLAEVIRTDELTRSFALGTERRDERGEDDQSGVGHQFGHFGDAPNVLDTVGVGEAEVPSQPVPHVVTVEEVGVASEGVQPPFEFVCDGRLPPRTGEPPREPDDVRPMAFEQRTGLAVHVDGLPMDVVRPAERMRNHSGTDGGVGQPVDEDEASGVAVVGIRIEGHRPIETDVADADLVEGQRIGRGLFQRVYVDLVLRPGDPGLDGHRADLAQVRPFRKHVVLTHPHQMRLELVGHAREGVHTGDDVAAADVDLVGERDRDGPAGHGLVEIAIHRHYPLHHGFTPARQHANPVSRPHDTTDDPTREARKSRSGRFTHCTGIRKGAVSSASSISTVSRWSISVGPVYHGVFGLGAVRLSPMYADIGTGTTCVRPISAANAAYSPAMRSKTSCE